MSNTVEMWSRYPNVVFGPERSVVAKCSACALEFHYRASEGEVIDAVPFLERALTERGCEHWREPFVDFGMWGDPRTEWSRTLAFADLTGSLEGFCPIQGRGRIGDLWWYYRDRQGSSFGISDIDEDDAARWAWTNDVDPRCKGRGWGMPEDFAEADSIPEAVAAITKAYETWVAAGRPLLAPRAAR